MTKKRTARLFYLIGVDFDTSYLPEEALGLGVEDGDILLNETEAVVVVSCPRCSSLCVVDTPSLFTICPECEEMS